MNLRKDQPGFEPDPIARSAEFEVTPVHIDEILRHSKTKTSPLLFVNVTVYLGKGVAGSLMMFLGHPWTKVPNSEYHLILLMAHREVNGAMDRREFYGVTQQMMQGVDHMNIININQMPESIFSKLVEEANRVLTRILVKRIKSHFAEQQGRNSSSKSLTGLRRMTKIDLLQEKEVIHQTF